MGKSFRIVIISGSFFIVVMVGLIYLNLSRDSKSKEIRIEVKEIIRDGDIIFQTSKSSQSKAIQVATKSKYSHMGIIYFKDNQPYVYEAEQPVSLTPLEKWIRRGKGKHYVVKRLHGSEKLLNAEVLNKMKVVGEKYHGKDYDIYFEWSDEKIYCSELVWKIYKEACGLEIGELEKLKDFDLSHKAVQQKLKERYGEKIPLDETVISPVSMFNSNKIKTVYEH